jgi:hypothetical protein
MSDTRKTITEIKAEERRLERDQNRRGLFKRFVSIIKFLLVVAVFAIALHHRAQIQKVCYAGINRMMRFFSLSSQARQKSSDYQNQLDEVTTN